jgi:hypothetical protein
MQGIDTDVPVKPAAAITNTFSTTSTTTNTFSTTTTIGTTSRQFDIRGYFPNDVIPVVRFISAILEPELPTTTKKAKIAVIVRYCDLSQAVRSSQATAAFKCVSTPSLQVVIPTMRLKRQRSSAWIIPSMGSSHASTNHSSSRNDAYSMIVLVVVVVAIAILIENCS